MCEGFLQKFIIRADVSSYEFALKVLQNFAKVDWHYDESFQVANITESLKKVISARKFDLCCALKSSSQTAMAFRLAQVQRSVDAYQLALDIVETVLVVVVTESLSVGDLFKYNTFPFPLSELCNLNPYVTVLVVAGESR